MSKIKLFIEYYKKANVAVKASLWFAFCSIVQKGISVITLPIFTRLMSTEQFGEYNIFLTWYNILVIIITLNIHSDIFNKGLIDNQDQKDKFTSNQAGLLIALAFMFVLIYLPLQNLLNKLFGLTTGLVLIMVLEILANALIGLWSARKRFDFEYIKIVILTLTMSVMNPIVGVLAVVITEHKAEARIVSNALVPIIFSIGIICDFVKKGKVFGNLKWWKPVVIASLPLIPHYLSLVLLNQSDKLMINYFSGASDAAIYSVAHSAGLLMTIINSSINSSFVPWAYGKMKNENGQGIKRISNILLFIVLVVNVGIIWLAPEVVRILAAPQYSVAIWCLVPIAVSVFFFFAYTMFVDIEIYYGANNYIAIASICAAILNLVLNYVFIPTFGYIAAGYTTLFSYFATMILHYIFLRWVLRKNGFITKLFDFKMLAFLSIVLCILSAIAMVLYDHMIVRFSIVAVICIVLIIERKKLIAVFKEVKGK